MSRKLIVLSSADEDIIGITAYIGRHNPVAALRFSRAVTRTINDLLWSPQIGREVDGDDPHNAGLRRVVLRRYRNYLMLYRVTPQAVEILRIIDGRQDLERILREVRE